MYNECITWSVRSQGAESSAFRRAVPLARNALEGVADLDSFLKIGDVTSVPKMGRALTDKVGILKRNARLVAVEGISADFIKEGGRLAEALSAAEGAQEKERKALPKEAEEDARNMAFGASCRRL